MKNDKYSNGFTLAEGATHVNSQPTKAKFGFTLAEVLITLGIIGVVAAMTIPVLITTHQQKATVTKLERAISVLNQAYRLSYDENGEASAQEALAMGADAYFKKYWEPYIKISRYCKNYKDCGYDKSAPYKAPSGSAYLIAVNESRAKFYTLDGFFYMILVDSGAGDNISLNTNIYLDLNGGEGPNIMGRDVFLLKRYVDDVKGGYVQPLCNNESNAVVNAKCIKSETSCCAEKIRRAGWKIEKDYPW